MRKKDRHSKIEPVFINNSAVKLRSWAGILNPIRFMKASLLEPKTADTEIERMIRKSKQYARQADMSRNTEIDEKRKNAFYEEGKGQVWYHRLR